MTRWRPDTCRCHVEFSADSSVATFVERCPMHLNVQAVDVWDENRSKNTALRVLFEEHQLDPDDVRWSFPKDIVGKRTVTVEVDRALPARTRSLLASNQHGAVQTKRTARPIKRLIAEA